METVKMMALGLALFASIIFIFGAGISSIYSVQSTASMTSSSQDKSRENVIGCHTEDTSPEFRITFGSRPRGTVYGYPSKGGLYVLEDCCGVELEFLGLDRFRSTLRPLGTSGEIIDEEEAHCDKRRLIFFSP
jgi:hypothetical protein